MNPTPQIRPIELANGRVRTAQFEFKLLPGWTAVEIEQAGGRAIVAAPPGTPLGPASRFALTVVAHQLPEKVPPVAALGVAPRLKSIVPALFAMLKPAEPHELREFTLDSAPAARLATTGTDPSGKRIALEVTLVMKGGVAILFSACGLGEGGEAHFQAARLMTAAVRIGPPASSRPAVAAG